MEKLRKNLPLLNVVLSLLCILMLVCQFLPFWKDGSNTCSLQGMLWFPNDQGSIPNHIADMTGQKFNIDSVVWLTLLTFITSVLGAIFCWLKRESFLPALLPLIGGVSGIFNYLTRPELQIGALWGMHLCLAVIMALLSLAICALGTSTWYAERHAR